MRAQSYFDYTGGQRVLDPFDLSRLPSQRPSYEPRACDLVEFEADERVQHVVLATPGIQAPLTATVPRIATLPVSDNAASAVRSLT